MNSPGKAPGAAAFLRQRSDATPSETLFRDYASYLLDAAGARQLPVPLERIREACKLQRHTAPIPQRGFLMGEAIVINSDDQATVQRFTEAHEMMETLAAVLRRYILDRLPEKMNGEFDREKEHWCEAGAAELLMPADLFFPLLPGAAPGLQTAKQLAGICRTSFTATVRRILDADRHPSIFLLLKEGHKKGQYVPSKAGQLVLWDEPEDWDPPARLRVWRYWASPQVGDFVCRNESFPSNSVVYRAFETGSPGEIVHGEEQLDLEYIKGWHEIEAMPVTISGERVVMALVNLLQGVR